MADVTEDDADSVEKSVWRSRDWWADGGSSQSLRQAYPRGALNGMASVLNRPILVAEVDVGLIGSSPENPVGAVDCLDRTTTNDWIRAAAAAVVAARLI